jgi:hypothetical protein
MNAGKKGRKKNALPLRMNEAHCFENPGTEQHSLSVHNTVNYYYALNGLPNDSIFLATTSVVKYMIDGSIK